MSYWIYLLVYASKLASACRRRIRFFSGLLVSIFSLLLCLLLLQGEGDAALSPVDGKARVPELITARVKTGVSIDSTADLADIMERGRLRVLIPAQGSHASRLSLSERKLIGLFGKDHGLQVDWIELKQDRHVFSYLHQGRGDIVLTTDTVPESMADRTQLTLPWGVSQQKVIARADTGRIRDLDDLRTRQIALKKSSPLWRQLQARVRSTPSMSLLAIDETEDVKTTLQKVASAQYDVTIVDNLQLEPQLPKFLTLEVAFNASDARPVSWALRSSSTELATALNSFLNKQYLQSQVVRSYQQDLPQLQSKKLLRLVTYQGPVNYFLRKGKLKGFEHDLLKRFADSQHMRLDVVIADSHEEMQELLQAGRADVIAASLPRRSIADNQDLAFTRAYAHAAPFIVGRTKDTPLLDINALSGRRVVLPASSPYREVMEKIISQGIKVELVTADAGESTESILFRVANGLYDLTVLGGHEIKALFSGQINVRAHFALTEPLPHVWAVRAANTQLLSALNEYIDREYRKAFYNVLYTKYIDKPRRFVADTQLLANNGTLSPFDDIVYKYAEHYDFDWRLIVAQMYQESRFNPDAVSYAGAEGLMQIVPETASLLGVDDSYDPDSSIQGGIRYMDYLRSKFEYEQVLEDRIWFSLAAYNAGYSRVQRARQLADDMNLDRNRWFDNVEVAMLALATPPTGNNQASPYCRCGQTVVYVRDIRTLYNNYVRLARADRTASNNSPVSKDI